MRAFVTGAAGFAGSHLVDHLLARGREVWGLVLAEQPLDNLDLSLSGPMSARLHLVPGDLLDALSLARTVQDIRPEEVYHLAAQASVRQSLADAAETFRVNVLGTQGLLEAIHRAPGRPRMLYVGSAEAYGETADRGVPLTEHHPLLPVTPYGSSKAAAERLVVRCAMEWGLAVVRVRPFPHTGPRHSPQFVYSDLARQISEVCAGTRPPRLQVGNLEVRRDLSDVRDVVRAYRLVLESGEPGEVYNVCSGRSYTLREVLGELRRLAGVEMEIAVGEDRLRPHDLKVLVGSPRALTARTGWRAEIPLEVTLGDLLAYWRDRPGSRGSGGE
jgi:GDP-4-dehydro-6-deoxy-D-mannose reductase